MLLDRALDLDLKGPLALFEECGFARLGQTLDPDGVETLRQRAQSLLLNERDAAGFFYQHDSATGRYEDLEYGQGWRGASIAYRKVEKLERDCVFRAWIDNPLFERIARRTIGADARIYRAVLWNKAPHGGTQLPWHQDDGVFWGLDRPPSLQIWTALDDASVDAGCLEVLPGSHRAGLATADGGTIPQDLIEDACAERESTLLPARAGESILLHNHTWHRSARNHTAAPRRAISIAFLSAQTRCTRKRRAPRVFPEAFRAGATDSAASAAPRQSEGGVIFIGP